jgi:opacity protein-like surface antigen
LFRGLGLAVAAGYRTGRFRVEGELHVHYSERAFTGDSLGLRALKGLALFAGAGIGMARAHVDIDTCLEPSGCSFSAVTDATEQGTAYQYMVGAGWLISKDRLLFVTYRGFRTEDLGIRNVDGDPYSDGRVDMPMGVFGYSWRF